MKLGTAGADGLAGLADEVHFDSAEAGIVEGVVGEAIHREGAFEFSIDAVQEVEVEGRGDFGGVVVGRVKDCGVFFQIDAN